MDTIHLHQTTTATPGQFLAGLADFGPGRSKIFPLATTVKAIEARNYPRHIVTGHQNSQLDDDARRAIDQTRRYLDDAEELLQTENTAVGFFNAKIERYPDHLGRMVLWVSARALYGVREHPGQNVAQIILNSWL